MPIFRECQRCTACCRWPGQVRLTEAEITRIAAFLKISEYDFIQRYTRLRSDRHGLVLQDQSDGACIFLEGDSCAIQSVKPQQCRDFPNLWHYPGAEQFCHAIPREVSTDEYVRLVAAATQRTPEDVREILRREAQ
ncbi:MAG: YkgJ family cysteine cluster protein [Verrucomicrobiae bacterium]|nr:YkgJ family cysteine cluster protein [Verrucomicrobiae bacterium]